MSKGPGGVTVRIDCMIIAGFPGIGKTSTFNEMKLGNPNAKVVDLDTKEFGTTNGMDVADPAAYAARVKLLSATNALIFVTADPQVREALRKANLFYVLAMPEFPREVGEKLGFHQSFREVYMQRFTMAQEHQRQQAIAAGMDPMNPVMLDTSIGFLSGDNKSAQMLEGSGYEYAIKMTFDDPMPHIVVPLLNKVIVTQIWEQIEQQTRTMISPEQLVGMGVSRPASSYFHEFADRNGGELPDALKKISNVPKSLIT